jgi:peroxiredoxin
LHTPIYHLWDADSILKGGTGIGGNRIIRSTVIIDPKGKIIKHWRKVPNAEKHPQKVLKVLSNA